jgi:serine/threonine protein kinase
VRTLAGKLRLLERIAIGGMGEIYRGQNLATGGDVAVKLLEPSLADDDSRERFRHEARVSAILAHPSVVRVFDLLEEPDGTLALVMELLAGETLEQRLLKGPLSPELAVATMHPILSALDHAHEVGIIHRDVKPANIFLAVAPDGTITPKLLDFGVAKTHPSTVQTMDGKVLGTARYMSPEQVRGEPLDGRSDVWSAAVVIYEAITGQSPFEAQDGPAAIAKVLECPVDPHERIPPRLWLVLERALSKQSYARQRTASALANDMLSALELSPDRLPRLASDRPPVPRLETRGEFRPVVGPASGEAAPSSARRFRASVVVAAFVGGAVVAASIVVGARSRSSSPPGTATPPGAILVEAVPSYSHAAVNAPPAAPATSESARITTPASAHAAPARVPLRSPSPTHAKPRPVATTPGF